MMDYNKLLQGKNAVISIGVQGIGKAIAELFASQGANVLIGGRKREKLDKAIAYQSIGLWFPCGLFQKGDCI